MENVSNKKIWILFVLLIVTMFFWITRMDSGTEKIISILILSAISYLLGRLHGRKICLGEIRAIGTDSGISGSIPISNN